MSFRNITSIIRPASMAARAQSRLVPASRQISSTPFLRTAAGYGDPSEEKIDNNTPTPSSTPDPKPNGQGQGTKSTSGTTDPEVKPKQSGGEAKESKAPKGQSTGNAGGDKGERTSKNPDEQDIKETKKIGEEPKKEEVGGAGPIGG